MSRSDRGGGILYRQGGQPTRERRSTRQTLFEIDPQTLPRGIDQAQAERVKQHEAEAQAGTRFGACAAR